MTYALVDEIRRAGAMLRTGTSWTWSDTGDSLVSSQHPQLEGPGEDQFVFSDKSAALCPMSLLRLRGAAQCA